VRTENASLERVIAALAERSHVRVEQLDPAWQRMRVTADLRERPLSQVLAYVLGSVGLRADLRGDVLSVRSDADSLRNADDAHVAALAVYMRVLRDHPEHAVAPEAELRQAQIEDRRGNPLAARAHFDAVATNYPESTLANEALLEAGEAAVRDGDWQSAAQTLLDFTRRSAPIEMQTRGRLALARAFAMLEQYERSLYALDAVDALATAATPEDRDARGRVRARALAGLDRGREALDLVGELERAGSTDEGRVELLELRALASDAAGIPGDAARAWLAFSQHRSGAERERALDAAADRALNAGDELGALFVARLARQQGVDTAELSRHEQRARGELALTGATPKTRDERLAAAEQAFENGDARAALVYARLLEPGRAKLAADERARLDRVHVRALAQQVGAEAAVERVRECLADESDGEARRRLYVLAAEIYEAEQRFDDAIDAYRGRL
jgi:hypothetical protein